MGTATVEGGGRQTLVRSSVTPCAKSGSEPGTFVRCSNDAPRGGCDASPVSRVRDRTGEGPHGRRNSADLLDGRESLCRRAASGGVRGKGGGGSRGASRMPRAGRASHPSGFRDVVIRGRDWR